MHENFLKKTVELIYVNNNNIKIKTNLQRTNENSRYRTPQTSMTNRYCSLNSKKSTKFNKISKGSTRAFRAAVGIQINIRSDISFVF